MGRSRRYGDDGNCINEEEEETTASRHQDNGMTLAPVFCVGAGYIHFSFQLILSCHSLSRLRGVTLLSTSEYYVCSGY
jgi:hypothetical protein